jgi:hypothetical protein
MNYGFVNEYDEHNKGVPEEFIKDYLDLLDERERLLNILLKPINDKIGEVEEKIIQARLDSLTEVPKCPECGSSVLVQKCFFESPQCPRFFVIELFGGSKRLKKRIEELEKPISYEI